MKVELGQGISVRDSRAVLKQMRNYIDVYPNREEFFNAATAGTDVDLPGGWDIPGTNCSIGVDVEGSRPRSRKSRWEVHYQLLISLVEECVGIGTASSRDHQGTGGAKGAGGFVYLVMNTQNAHKLIPRCMVTQLRDGGILQCVLGPIEAVQLFQRPRDGLAEHTQGIISERPGTGQSAVSRAQIPAIPVRQMPIASFQIISAILTQ